MKVFRSYSVISLVLAFALFAQGTAVAQEDSGSAKKSIFTKHFQDTLFDITSRGTYSIEVLLDEKEYKIGKDVIGIVVHDAHDEDVKGADLRIVLKNLATNEISSGAITVADKKNGLYLVSGLDLRREGKWELAIAIKKDGTEDQVKFVLPDALKERVPKGKYSP